MKVLLINGSPHREGCTYTALAEVAGALEKEGIETEIFHIGIKPIQGCTACKKCKDSGSNRCVFDNDPANVIIEKMESCDGMILGSPVHYAKPAGNLLALCDRAFYAGSSKMAQKPGAAVSSARRAGNTVSIDAMNKYFQISGMPIVPSKYWPMVHGNSPEEVLQDKEGLQTMRMLGKNMAWMLKAIDAGKKAGVTPPEAEDLDERTNFIR